MADLHHGTFSYSTSPTVQDLIPLSHRQKTTPLSSDASQKFHELTTIFQNSAKGSSGDAGGESNTSKARDSALPCLSFSPIHALALGLESFEEESLKCIVFGNISPDNYIDMFWDIVQNQNEKSWNKLVVYEAERSSEPKVVICFQNQLFEIRYIRCDVLVREYPRVTDASDSFLRDPENRFPQTVQDVIKMIQRGSEIHENLNEFPAIRTAYSYIKRWVAIRGLAKDLPDNQIFKILQEYQKTDPDLLVVGEVGDPSSAVLINQFFKQDAYKIDPLLASTHPAKYESFKSEDWENMVSELNSLALSEKWNVPHTIRVQVTYYGVSQMKGAQWLLMVQRKLIKLKDRLERSIPGRPSVQVWPQRLIQKDATPSDDVYEGNFVLGIQLSANSKKQDLQTVQELAENWREQTERDRATVKGQCFIKFSYDTLPDLTICTRKWPRQVLTGENVLDSDNESDSQPTSKPRKKGKENTPTANSIKPLDKARRFRTAAEVLSRLKFDQQYDLDEFVIGYMDRIKDKILEKPAADWDRETTAEEFIPEHRIEYFKRYDVNAEERGEILWQKSTKVDRIFRKGEDGV